MRYTFERICIPNLVLFVVLFQLFAVASEDATNTEVPRAASTAGSSGSNSKPSPALTGVRHPLYRLCKSDVIDVQFTFSPEFNQTLTIQPDGFISLKDVGDIVAEGLTLADLREAIRQAYTPMLRDPEVTVILRDFDKPYFVAGGQIGHPGKYELRSPTTVSEAIAIAGGFNDQAKHSQVVLFRRVTDELVESHVLDIKHMLASKNLEEDMQVRAGDMLFVPQNKISKIKKFLPVSSLSAFLNPGQL